MMPCSMLKYLLVSLALLLPYAPLYATDQYISTQAAYQLLVHNQDEKVRALPKGEREVLLATLELKQHKLDAAIAWLSPDVVQHNPLAALLVGEAYRRKSLASALRAGAYAHDAYDHIKTLREAELTPALQEAEQHLQAFMRLQPPVSKHGATVSSELQASVKKMLQAWLEDWQSGDHQAYISHYDRQFHTPRYNYQSWSEYKQRINRKKSYIRVHISHIHIKSEPNPQGEGVIVTFDQDYQSSNYNARGHKALYLLRRHQGAPWLILEEGQSVHSRHINTGHSLPAKAQGWIVNIASFKNMRNAQNMLDTIQGQKWHAFVSDARVAGKKVYRIQAGTFPSQGAARQAMQTICTKLNIADCWLEKKG